MAKKTKKSLEEQEKELTKAMPDYPQFEHANLTAKQQAFVYWYCHPEYNYNSTRAYCKAYDLGDIDDYASAASSASRLLKNVNIMDAIDIERRRRIEDHEQLAEFVLKQWHNMAQADITEALNIVGPIIMVKDLSEIPQHLRSCIKSIKTTSNGVEVVFHDKHKALENLAKALGMFIERTQNVNETYESLVDKVERKRREAKDA
jgi:phage terminase small subunit